MQVAGCMRVYPLLLYFSPFLFPCFPVCLLLCNNPYINIDKNNQVKVIVN